MSNLLSQDNSKPEDRTDAQVKADKNVSDKIESLTKAIEDRSKTSGKEPEYVFAIRVAEGVKTSWKNGKIPTATDFKDDCSDLGKPSKEITGGSALGLAIKATLIGHVQDLAEKYKATIKKKTPDISDEELKTQVKNFVVGVYEVAKERKEQYDKDVKARSEKAKADKLAKASQPQSQQ